MSTAVRSTFTVFLFLVFCGASLAQEQQGTGTAAPVVTATASTRGVRYVSVGEVQQSRLQVFSSDGALIFDSSYRDGNLIDWQLTDQQGSRVKDGSYLFLVTVRDFSGQLSQKYGSATVEQEQVYLERGNRDKLQQSQALALEANKQSAVVAPIDRIGAAGLNLTTTVTTSGNSTENRNQSEKSAASNKTERAGDITPLAGTGTTNQIVKWADTNGTLRDSALTEKDGNFGIGTTDPQARFHVFGEANQDVFTGLGPDVINGPAFNMGYAGQSFGRGAGFFNVRPDPLAVGPNPSLRFATLNQQRMIITRDGNIGIGVNNPQSRLEVAGNLKLVGANNGIIFADGTIMTTANSGAPSGSTIINAINAPATVGTIADNRLPPNLARLSGANTWSGANVFTTGLSANNALITNVGNPVNAGDAVNKAYVDAGFVQFVPGAEQLSVGDANGTAPMINLRGGSTCCSGPGGHTPAWFKVFQNGSFVATGNLGIGVSPMEGKGYRTSWDTYKGAFRSGYADNEWNYDNVGFFSWAGGSNSTASGLYALAFGDTNFARSTSSIAFGSGNEVKGAAGFSAGAGNRVCDTYGVALGNNARSGGPYIDGKCDPETFNIRGLAAVAIGYNVTADQDHTMALGKFASNNGFQGTFIWSDGAPQATADTFRNTANNEFAARATGGFRFRTNLGGTTGCNLPAGSGVFNCTSSRYTKENFLMIGGEDVLARLRNVPVSSWNYISEGKKVRHIGPMAEDFFKAFGLGTSDTAIGVQDLAGVNLAAVKALDERTAELQQRTLELQKKTEEVEQLRGRVNTLEERMANMERAMQANQAAQASQDK